MSIKEYQQKAIEILKNYPVSKADFFGSILNNEFNDNSDIDILVSFNEKIGLLKFISLKNSLEQKFNRKVDLVEFNSIKPALKDSILSNSYKFYG